MMWGFSWSDPAPDGGFPPAFSVKPARTVRTASDSRSPFSPRAVGAADLLPAGALEALQWVSAMPCGSRRRCSRCPTRSPAPVRRQQALAAWRRNFPAQPFACGTGRVWTEQQRVKEFERLRAVAVAEYEALPVGERDPDELQHSTCRCCARRSSSRPDRGECAKCAPQTGWRQLPWPVDDNYLGRLRPTPGRSGVRG